ncbi:MAG TPA: aldo/keto reductase, partial [Thermoanaerobaculia bacterium]|nr:aldo/keto reductase [Thermoanaerobaculia bacterium]
RAEGIAVIPWSPLARGVLAGGRRQGLDGDSTRAKTDDYARMLYGDSDLEIAGRVAETARRRDMPPARIALAWLLSRPGVTAPIVGASRIEHLDDAVASLDVSLSEEERRLLEEPYRPHAVRGHS